MGYKDSFFFLKNQACYRKLINLQQKTIFSSPEQNWRDRETAGGWGHPPPYIVGRIYYFTNTFRPLQI